QLQLLLGGAHAQGQGIGPAVAAEDAGDGRRVGQPRLVAPRVAHLPRQTLSARLGHHQKIRGVIPPGRADCLTGGTLPPPRGGRRGHERTGPPSLLFAWLLAGAKWLHTDPAGRGPPSEGTAGWPMGFPKT